MRRRAMTEDKIRNLEMIQNIITRMANNSFLLKGWSITIISGLFSLNLEKLNFAIYFLVYSVIILFLFVDTYYLQLERRYRALYEECRKMPTSDFCMNLSPPKFEEKTLYYQVLLSGTELGFYLFFAIIITVVFYII